MTQFKLFDMFVNTYGHQTELEYISLFLVVPLMYLVMGSMQNYLRNKLFLFFAITGSALAIGLIVVHFAGIIHINRLLGIYQIDALVLCVFMIVMLIRDSRHKRITPSQIIQLIGQSGIRYIFWRMRECTRKRPI